jgi:Family of unknown function (DUF6496)
MATKKKATRKYSKAASQDVERTMHERKEGTLRSGTSNKKVTSRKQAIAIGLSEARREGKKVPPPPKKTSGKSNKSK